MQYKLYDFVANMVVETSPLLVNQIEEEILDAIIEVVEKHNSFVGGGFELKEIPEPENESVEKKNEFQ